MALAGLVFIGIFYTIMYDVLWGYFFPVFDPLMAGIGNQTVVDSYATIKNTIFYFPLMFIFGVYLWAIMRSIRRENETYATYN
jgi:hypothetical protein